LTLKVEEFAGSTLGIEIGGNFLILQIDKVFLRITEKEE